MHEWAIAESIVSSLEKEVKRHGLEAVEKLVVSLGELQAIDEDVLRQALEMMLSEHGIRVGELVFKTEKVVFRCRRCGSEWSLDDLELGEDEREAIHFVPEAVYSYVKCPSCGSRDFTIVSGRGVRIELYTGREG